MKSGTEVDGHKVTTSLLSSTLDYPSFCYAPKTAPKGANAHFPA